MTFHPLPAATGRLRATLAAWVALAALAPWASSAQAAGPECSSLADATVPATQIGLPTKGARITEASRVAATLSTPAYCQLLGEIAPVDPDAPVIRFQVNLPEAWNGKSMHLGGGGFDGKLITGTADVPHAWPGAASPLQRGYATFGSDSGHQALGSDGRFALNDEALQNFTGNALKKLRDVAQQLMLQRYGRGPVHSYFAGGSSGGREALAVAQRWPADYDGIIANYPALEYVGILLQANRFAKALYGPGGFLSWAKLDHLNSRVLQACDRLDGLADGLVNHLSACRFDPVVLRCPSNIDWGAHCLTDAQLATVRALADDQPLAYPLSQGLRSSLGYEVLGGANFAGPVDIGLLPVLLNPAQLGLNGFIATMMSEYLKYFITQDRGFDPLTFDAVSGGRWQARVQQVSGWHDATNTNLDAFIARGGRILMLHGLSDTVVTPRASVRYVQRLQARYGVPAVRQFLRFYTAAGFGHGEGRYNLAWPSLDLLEAWVERGQVPEGNGVPISRNTLSLTGQSRPLCEHPAYPRYVGGLPDQAASFVCTTP